jgi:hypothetical protein
MLVCCWTDPRLWVVCTLAGGILYRPSMAMYAIRENADSPTTFNCRLYDNPAAQQASCSARGHEGDLITPHHQPCTPDDWREGCSYQMAMARLQNKHFNTFDNEAAGQLLRQTFKMDWTLPRADAARRHRLQRQM